MIVRVKILFLLGLLAASALEAGSTSRREARVGISEPSRESRNEIPETRLVIRVIDGQRLYAEIGREQIHSLGF